MWDLHSIDTAQNTFFVYNGSVRLARWAVDPAVPWTLVEGHHPIGLDWRPMLLPLNGSSLATPSHIRARNVQFDLLLPTEIFLEKVAELGDSEPRRGGIVLWQLDREPPTRFRFSDKLFDDQCDIRMLYREHGVRLSMLVPHENEVTVIGALDLADLQRAWHRIQSATGD